MIRLSKLAIAGLLVLAGAVRGEPGYVATRVQIGDSTAFTLLRQDNKCLDRNGNGDVLNTKEIWVDPKVPPVGVTTYYLPDPQIGDRNGNHYFRTSNSTPVGLNKIKYEYRGTTVSCYSYIYWDVTVIPKITAEKTRMYWFGGEEPANYPVSMKLRSFGDTPGPYTWTIEEGSEIAQFGNNQSTITTAAPEVEVRSRGGVAKYNQFEVSLTINGIKSNRTVLKVVRPSELAFKGIEYQSSDKWGYKVTYTYSLYDDLGDPFGQPLVPVHEEFTSPLYKDYVGTNWRESKPNGRDLLPAAIQDEIGGEYLLSNTFTPIPRPLPPKGGLSTVKVDHQSGRFVVGSANPAGGGVPVATLVWQKYVNHAAHENFVSPITSERR